MRILTICGSLQARSGNLALLEVAGRVAPDGVEVGLSLACRRVRAECENAGPRRQVETRSSTSNMTPALYGRRNPEGEIDSRASCVVRSVDCERPPGLVDATHEVPRLVE